MIFNKKIIKAINIAYDTHRNEKDKIGIPYIFHPYKVAEKILEEESQFGGIKDCEALENCIIIALLHDVIESEIDKTKEFCKIRGYKNSKVEKELIDITIKDKLSMIKLAFGEIVSEAVKALTRNDNETYNEYIDRVCKNPYAVKVKIHDIKHNLNVNRMKLFSDEKKESLSKRYMSALEKLVKFEKL